MTNNSDQPIIQPSLIEEVEAVAGEDVRNSARRLAFEVNELRDLPFTGAYETLREQGWYYVDAAYIAWKSLPKKARYPETAFELANRLGVSTATINKRRQKNPMIDEEASKLLLAGNLLGEADGVIEALTESAANKSYKHHADRKLFLEMAGLYTPKQAIDVRAGAIEGQEAEKSEEELRRIASKADAAALTDQSEIGQEAE